MPVSAVRLFSISIATCSLVVIASPIGHLVDSLYASLLSGVRVDSDLFRLMSRRERRCCTRFNHSSIHSSRLIHLYTQ